VAELIVRLCAMKALLRALRLKRVWISLIVVSCAIACTALLNGHGLREGIAYLLDGVHYQPVSEHPIRKDGPFGLAHRLVSLSSLERMSAIKRTLSHIGVRFEGMAVARGYENIFVPGDLSKGFLLIEAHYDKAVDAPAFQAATDNTGSVVILLETIRLLREELPNLPVAFLFTALEEEGLTGAFHFIENAQRRDYRIKGALCLDMVGRGKPVVATSAEAAGFRFDVPFYGSVLYNGRTFARGPRVWPIDTAMRDTYLSRIRVYKAFVSYTDASAFLQRGVPALHLEGANMWHADQVWGRYTDTLERLDERDMLECRRLIEQVVKQLDGRGEQNAPGNSR
jgi:hypothetical protein